MTLLEDMPRAITGAWRLFRWQPDGVEYFDQTIDGFWRSFFAPLMIAPIYYFVAMGNHAILQSLVASQPDLTTLTVAPLKPFLIAKMSAFALGVIAFPIVMVLLARLLNLSSRYVPLIIAYNWSSIIIIAIVAAPIALHAIGILGVAGTSILSFLAFLIWPFYLYNIIKSTTLATTQTVVGLVVFEIALTYVVSLAIEQIYLGSG